MQSSSFIKKIVTVGAAGTIVAHISASVLQNTPDAYNQELTKYTFGWTIPVWRFFAPNPGVQNVHLLVREKSAGEEATRWRDITPVTEHTVFRVIWNPKSRGPKALFDALQQLTVYQANSALFEWVVTSQPYKLVSLASKKEVSIKEGTVYQFMILNVEPTSTSSNRFKPVLTSEWISVE